MNRSLKGPTSVALLALALFTGGSSRAQPPEIPDILQSWKDWATWDDKHLDCPTTYDSAETRICFWPSRLSLSADQTGGSWNAEVSVFSESWIPLPGSDDVWPLNVTAGEDQVAVVERNGTPSVRLPAGRHQLSGRFSWEQMPQRIAIPNQIGLLTLTVEGTSVAIPNWDASGNVWLRRVRSEVTDKDQISAQVYRVLEDGIPMWLRTEIELTVSGKSREEELGWVLPEGWNLSLVESPIPVAIDERGRTKAQVRAGKWTIRVDAFRSVDVPDFQFASDATPITNVELIGFRQKPQFRLVEIEGTQAVDVTLTTFPEKWRDLPVYQWNTDSAFQIVEKMRGMGLQRPEGLSIDRQFWLDEDGKNLTFRDRIKGQMQQIWRLDVAEGQRLGAVRIDGKGQLITANPQSGANGVELRTRNLNLEAIGRTDRTTQLSATGWRTDAGSLSVTLTLPPGWRVFSLFGADRVDGDWLTAWSLLDLFLLLIFSLAVFRMWGVSAGVVAFLAFGLSYHEFGSPRITWLFLLMPLALLRVVPKGWGRRWITAWKYLAVAFLLMCLVPFVARQMQSAIYPQLERPGVSYAPRSMFMLLGSAYQKSAYVAEMAQLDSSLSSARGIVPPTDAEPKRAARFDASNVSYGPQTIIQTGPAEPTWSWNQVYCAWDGPVSASQQLKPILISLTMHRVLTVLRILLLCLLAAILLGVRGIGKPMSKRSVQTATMLLAMLLPSQLSAQIPDRQMLDTLRQRLLETSDAYPRAADIASVMLAVDETRMTMSMECEIHAALDVAVPLPGKFPTWSPVSVKLDGQQDVVVCRRDGFLWAIVPRGVHKVSVEGLLPNAPEWEWTYLLKPRRVSILAPGWSVTGMRPNGVPEQQVFFTRVQPATDGEAAYDRTDFQAIVAVDRHLEIGLIWKLRTEVTRLSPTGKAASLNVPLLENESVLTSNVVAENGLMQVRLGANQDRFAWESELPIGQPIALQASATDQWVERWHLVTSPVWNVSLSGLSPVFQAQEQNLIPVWQPWSEEAVDLSFSRPEAVSGDVITVRHVHHESSVGHRQRNTQLQLELESSLGSDFIIELDANADISSLQLDDQSIPVRRIEDGKKLVVSVNPGKQVLKAAWRTSEPMSTVVVGERVVLPVNGSNITTVARIPESRWVLWAEGPLRGPAVRFWTILVFAIVAAVVLGSVPFSPLRRWEWVLLALGLTQVHVSAAMIVVVWLFLLAWRGKQDAGQMRWWRFNLLQMALVLLTLIALGILIVIVGEGLLGDPEMFIIGNGSSQTRLQWFQPRAGTVLPAPFVVSISVWFYRLLMLFWALWLATALLRWLKWGWAQFSRGGGWKRRVINATISPPSAEATS